MWFVIVGAGAIGGSAGAYLMRAGHEVLLVDSAADHVRAMQTDGLTMEGRLDFTVRPEAVTPDGLAAALAGRAPEAVILAVKAQHTEEALTPLVPLLGSASFVLSMQNGLNPRFVANFVGADRTIAAFVNSMGTDYLSPGRIMYGGLGTMYIGELDGRLTPRIEHLARIFQADFVAIARATSNIWGYLWGKESFGAMLFAGATVDDTIANLLGNPANRSLIANIAAEVVRVAEAEGVRCEPFDGFDPNVVRFARPRDWEAIGRSLANLESVYRRSLKQKSGIWRDLAVRSRPTEVDAQLGIAAELGRQHGIAVPLLERVIDMIHDIEHHRRPMQPDNLEQLQAFDREVYPDIAVD